MARDLRSPILSSALERVRHHPQNSLRQTRAFSAVLGALFSGGSMLMIATAVAQTPTPQTRVESAETRSERMLDALGGRARWATLTSLVNDSYQHRSEAPTLVSARITLDLTAPRWRIETTAPDLHTVRVWDGTRELGWRLTRDASVEDLPKTVRDEDLRWHRGHLYRNLHQIAKRDSALTLRIVDDRLEAYEDKQRVIWFRLTSEGEPYAFGALDDALGSRCGPWNFERDGLRHPSWVSNASGTWRADVYELATNVELEDALFARPKFLQGMPALLGTWRGSGEFLGKAAQMDLQIEDRLANAFVRWQINVKYAQQLAFSGELNARRDLQGLHGTWIDSSGEQLPVSSLILGDCVRSDWQKGYSRYCLRAADVLSIEDFSRDAAVPFGRYELKRVASTTSPTAVPTSASKPNASALPCPSKRYREFDFWLGNWQVETNGQVIASSRITLAQNGCVLHEDYRIAASGYHGQSLNIFDASRGTWHQTWVDNSGMLLRLDGGLRDGVMVLEGARQLREGEGLIEQRERIRWTPNADGTVRQQWESRKAGGEWTTAFDGIYRKSEPN